jgi:hypothetical protein
VPVAQFDQFGVNWQYSRARGRRAQGSTSSVAQARAKISETQLHIIEVDQDLRKEEDGALLFIERVLKLP